MHEATKEQFRLVPCW